MSKAKTGFALTLSNNDTFAKKKKEKKSTIFNFSHRLAKVLIRNK